MDGCRMMMLDDDAGDPHAWQRAYMAVVTVGMCDRSHRSAEVVGDRQSKVEPHPANVAPIPVLGESCTEALPRTAPTRFADSSLTDKCP